jgi:hypothetical protein
VRRHGPDRGIVDAFHRLDRREFSFGAAESLRNLPELDPDRVELFIRALIRVGPGAGKEGQLESRTNATRVGLMSSDRIKPCSLLTRGPLLGSG